MKTIRGFKNFNAKYLLPPTLGVLLFTGFTTAVQAEEPNKYIGTDVTPTYEWTIDLGMLIKPITVTKQTVYLLDSNNNKVDTVELKVERNRKEVTITPTKPFNYNEEYTIVITNGVQSVFVNKPFEGKNYKFKTISDLKY